MNFTEYFKPKNWRNFVEGTYNYAQWKGNSDQLPSYMIEQIAFRAYLCRDCLVLGHCKGPHCSCSTPGVFFSPNKSDDPNWGRIITDVLEWEKVKQTNDDYKEWKDLYSSAELQPNSPDIFKFIISIHLAEQSKLQESKSSVEGQDMGLKGDKEDIGHAA